MFRESLNFESILNGSHVNFKKRERPPLSEQERELEQENRRELGGGISILRKLRTRALEEQDPTRRQNLLHEAHALCGQMAEIIFAQAAAERPTPLDQAFLGTLQKLSADHKDTDAGSSHGLSPSFSIQNLFRATDDMLSRIEEQADSIETPSHKLSKIDMEGVLREFLRGTNDLSLTTAEKIFESNVKVGGILSGGGVYLELVKMIAKKYGDDSLAEIDSFMIAVDKDTQKIAVETSNTDTTTLTIILTDDMIDKGDTMLTALWKVGEYFPKAKIYSGKGTDQAGGFDQRRDREYLNHTAILFQDFADLVEQGRNDDALVIFHQAEQYATEHGITLQPGWYKVKKRIDTK